MSSASDTVWDNTEMQRLCINLMQSLKFYWNITGSSGSCNTYSSVITTFEQSTADIIYQFHMPLFFILSGFVMSVHKSSAKLSPLMKNIKKLLIPYLLWSIIYIAFGSAECLYKGNDIVHFFAERLYAAFSFRGIAPIWFLGALFLCKLFYEAVICRKGRPKTSALLIWMLIFFCLSVIGNVLFKKIETGIFLLYPVTSLMRFFVSCFFLLFGSCIGFYSEWIKKHKIWLFVLSAAMFIVQMILIKNNVNMHLFNIDYMTAFIVSGISGSMAIITACMCMPKNLYIRKIGQKSQDIMLLHYPPVPVWYLLVFISDKINIRINPLISTFILIAVCCLISIFFLDRIRHKLNVNF